jgi:hypothetical protein
VISHVDCVQDYRRQKDNNQVGSVTINNPELKGDSAHAIFCLEGWKFSVQDDSIHLKIGVTVAFHV